MPKNPFELQREAELARLRPHFVRWLDRWRWTHFVTLATNDHRQNLSPDILHRRLRGWDAAMNRRLFGQKWTRRPDERLFAAYFLEKPTVNPHWHGLIMLDHPDPRVRIKQAYRLRWEGGFAWRKLNPGGTIDVQEVNLREGIAKYVTKEVGHMIQYNFFVAPRAFDPTAQ
jgi:hypothetical protein